MADEIDVETWAGLLPEKYLACRELGHTWRPWQASYDPAEQAYERVLRCPRCRTERVQLLTTGGHVLGNRYNYPDGYQAKNVHDMTASRDVFRLEAVLRFMSKHDDTAKAG
jgi:hypothetical protein